MIVKINGMTCEHCKKTVEKFFSMIDGVQNVNVDLEGGLAKVESSRKIEKEEFAKALEDTAYEVIEVI